MISFPHRQNGAEHKTLVDVELLVQRGAAPAGEQAVHALGELAGLKELEEVPADDAELGGAVIFRLESPPLQEPFQILVTDGTALFLIKFYLPGPAVHHHQVGHGAEIPEVVGLAPDGDGQQLFVPAHRKAHLQAAAAALETQLLGHGVWSAAAVEGLGPAAVIDAGGQHHVSGAELRVADIQV